MLELRHASLGHGRIPVIEALDLRLSPGQRLGILGPSGSGKSTLLKVAAGLLAPLQGECRNTFARPVLVFQEPRLLPWRTVLDNLLIALQAAGHEQRQARPVAEQWLARTGLSAAANLWPGQLSGGMAQRAALARAFAVQADLLMLDEPFSALDPALRNNLIELCRTYLRDSGAALLCVSHQPHEVVELADQCLLLHQGRAQHLGLDEASDDDARRHLAQCLQARLVAMEPDCS